MSYIEGYKGAGITSCLDNVEALTKYFWIKYLAYPQKRDMIWKAVEFAKEAHEGQCRKGTNIPYVIHPLEAGHIVDKLTNDSDIICAAILHDILEDTQVSRNKLREEFGDRVLRFVEINSEDSVDNMDKAASWKLRKQRLLAQVNSAPKEAQYITLGDKLSNLRAIYRDYTVLGNEVFNRFHQKDKAEQKWYYSQMIKALVKFSDNECYDEMVLLFDEVFGDI